MPVGIMASAVHTAAATCTDVLSEPFHNLTAWSANGTPTIVVGRTGTAANITGTTTRLNYAIPAIAQSDVVTMGFAFRTPALQANHSIINLCSDNNTTTHTALESSASGDLDVIRNGTPIATSANGLIAINTWYYIEIQFKLGDAPNGYAIVRLNGTEVVNATGLDTKSGGTKTVYDTVRLGQVNASSGGTNQYDDLYISTGSGCTFKGDQTYTTPAAAALPVTSGLQLHLDADDASTFTYSSGTIVSQWADKSGSGRHIAQGTVANQPSRSSGQEGRITVVFDGVTDYLDTAAFTVAQPMTVFLATDTTSEATQSWLASVGGNFQIYSDSVLALFAGSQILGGLYSGAHCWTFTADGASSSIRRDGSITATGNIGTTGTTTGFRLGAERALAAGFYLEGEVFEAIVYNRVVSVTERTDIEAYLRTKWGIVMAFPTIATQATEAAASMGTTQTIEPPSDITAGDLLICFVSHDGGTTVTLAAGGAGWTLVNQVTVATTVHSVSVFGRIATGDSTSGNDMLVLAGAATDYCAYYARITGHGVTNVLTDIRSATSVNTTGNVDPPVLYAGDSRKWRWFAAAAVDTNASATLTAVPASYTQVANLDAVPGSTTGSILGVATRELEATNDNPGTFTNSSRNWAAATVAIPPDDGVVGTTYTYEEGTDGATVAVGTGIDQVTGTPTYEADDTFHGAMGLRMAGASHHVRYAVPADHSGSVYIKAVASPGTTSTIVMSWGTTANSINWNLRFHSDGEIHITDTTNAQIGADGTIGWAVGDEFRFDWQADETAGFTTQMTLRIFKNANIEGTIPDEEVVRTTPTYAGSTTRVRLRTTTASYTFGFDTLRLAGGLQWLGPYA